MFKEQMVRWKAGKGLVRERWKGGKVVRWKYLISLTEEKSRYVCCLKIPTNTSYIIN